jgi:signal transduction histidine kinase
LRERLLHSQRIETIGEISAGVAHEFKNVLVPILGSAELASMDLPESHPGQKWLKQIIKSAHCARDLVQQILTFGRETCSTRSPISLADVVNGALRMLRAAVPKTVEIRREVAANLPVVMADAGQISQIIMNLGINAWQAMQHRGGTIHCSLDLAAGPDAEFPELPFGQFVRLKLTDTGKGMAPDVAARVFEPFFTTKPPGEGTGLGLSVVHGIVKSHNGFINVTSSPGSGTTFTIFFPAVTNNS